MTKDEFRKNADRSSEQAQRALFDEYFSYVYTIVYGKLRSCAKPEDIEECVGDVFADVYIYYNENKAPIGNISAFIGTVARRKAIDVYKKLTKNNLATVSVDDEETAELKAPDNTVETVEKKELRSILLKCIELLGTPDSTIIMQKYFFMRSSKEIAELVSMTPEAVRVRSSRALEKLRKQLSSMGIKEGLI
ncbi:MAG: sigma-70 family RNA polymerase sigma factor [Ruminococcus sp.]|uniref:RNA polymerase sigma factor n=1 Tax=Ruminococcus sp. TaxID=41978 RepID=UPI0025EC89F4|nr:sigma-70 family RNA polymerase sigma factor [Ruminococcus sp.]MCR5600866.1 sigma-70 family RNA polymerase sigma factor [Ruminococcus sp.]